MAVEKELAKIEDNEEQVMGMRIKKNTAILAICSFAHDIDVKGFLEASFHKIDSMGIKNIVFDIRKNGGGTSEESWLLFDYCCNKKMVVDSMVFRNSRAFRKMQKQNYSNVWLEAVRNKF